jgi:hypothetical protein
MTRRQWLGWVLVAALFGGTQAFVQAVRADDKEDEAKIQKNLSKLPKADRKIAEQQKFCVIEDENRLGEMGVPVKLEIKGQTVFLCCKSCVKEAKADPDKTLAKAKELREKNKKESKQ